MTDHGSLLSLSHDIVFFELILRREKRSFCGSLIHRYIIREFVINYFDFYVGMFLNFVCSHDINSFKFRHISRRFQLIKRRCGLIAREKKEEITKSFQAIAKEKNHRSWKNRWNGKKSKARSRNKNSKCILGYEQLKKCLHRFFKIYTILLTFTQSLFGLHIMFSQQQSNLWQ